MEEELKKQNLKTAKTAGEENKDKDSLAYDQKTHRLIDIDDILFGDFKIAQKFNNLSKYGITTEQVKKIYEMSGDTSSNQSLEDILKELEKVFSKLANKINTNPNIGIVIDFSTGKEDVEQSKKKCVDLGIDYETFEKKETEEKRGIMDLISEAIEEAEKIASPEFEIASSEFESFFDITEDDIYDFFKNYTEVSEEDYEVLFAEIGIPKTSKTKQTVDDVDIKEMSELNVIMALYKYRKTTDPKKIKEAEENLEKAIQENPNTKYNKYLIDENGNIDFDQSINFLNDWEKKKNLADVFSNMVNVLKAQKENINFYDIKTPGAKKKISLILLMSNKYADNEDIKKLRECMLERFNLKDLPEEKLLEFLKSTLAYKDISDEELEKLIATHEMNDKTSDSKLMKVGENIADKRNKGKSYYQRTNFLSPENTFKSLEEKIIFEIISSNEDKQIGHDKELKGLEIINLYNSYYIKEGKDSSTLKHLKAYIIQNREYFDEYFSQIGEENIFNQDDSVSITRIQRILDRQFIDKRIKEDTESMIEAIDSKREWIKQVREGVQNYIDELSNLKEDKIDEEKENRVLEILDTIDFSALDEELIKKLKGYKSDKINDRLDKVLKTYDGMTKLLTRNMERITKDDAMAEDLLLLEARLKYSKGTADYANNLNAMNDYLDKYPESSEFITEKYRDKTGNIRENGKTALSNYVNGLFYETLKYNIEQTDIRSLDGDGRRIFTTMLIAGLEDDDFVNNVTAIEKIKEVYPGFSNIKDSEELRKNVYSIVYGKEIADKPDEIEKRKKEIKENLIVKILKKKELHDLSKFTTIKDNEFSAIFERIAVPLDASQIDLSKSEMQSKFDGSEIEFSEENDKAYKELYRDTTVNSWISNKKEVATLEIALLLSKGIEENGKGILTKGSINIFSGKLNRLYIKHPDLKGKFENDKEFREKAIENAKVFEKNKTISDLLQYYQKDILVNAQNYSKLGLSDKKDIFRYALFANKYSKKIEDPKAKELLQKLSNRAFELMNSEKKTYISFDKDGNGVLNEENILEEAKEVFKEKKIWENFDDLLENVSERQELLYIPFELHRYEKIKDDKYFEPLKEGTADEKLAQIEQKNMFITTKREIISQTSEILKEPNTSEEKFSEERKKNAEQKAKIEITENQSEYKKEVEQISGTPSIDVEEIQVEQLDYVQNSKVSFMDKIKNAINKFRQPKLTDGRNSLENKNGILASLALKVKNIFSNEGKKEIQKSDNIIADNARNSQKAYGSEPESFNERIKVENYNLKGTTSMTQKSKETVIEQSESMSIEEI